MNNEEQFKIKNTQGFEKGYNAIVLEENHPEYLMDFGILKVEKDMEYVDDDDKERAFLLLSGEAKIIWENSQEIIKRSNIFDDNPWTLHVPRGVTVKIIGLTEESELAVHKTYNDKKFESKLYGPNDCVIETRGKGKMNETGTRLVRTIIDHSISPSANLMLGEDVHYPGKWAGFPSHSHPQPEIYFYRFYPQNGFGLLKLGDDGVCLEENDTVLIPPDLVHPQVVAPGYAMYFIWVIRHLENKPYIKPNFEEQHLWVEQDNAIIWPDR